MPKNKPSEETLVQARRVIDALNERGARKQAIRLKVTLPDAPLPQTASKFGGRPYLPAGESAPTNEKGEPLGMIAQINCADLPENDIYPATGMLQFWINPNDEECLWGFDYENPLSQKNHRVVYYETLGEPNPEAPFPTVNWDDYGWPFGRDGKGTAEEVVEYALAFEPWEQGFLDGGFEIYDQLRYVLAGTDGSHILNRVICNRHPGIALRDRKLRREIAAEHFCKTLCGAFCFIAV